MNHKIASSIVTVCLISTIMYGYTVGNAYKYADEMLDSVIGEVKTELIAKDSDGNTIPEFSTVTSDLLSNLSFKQKMVDFNGTLAKRLNLREIYQANGSIVLNNGSVVSISPYTTTDYEIEQIIDLKNFLDQKGIPLLYVNEPTKYFDDEVIRQDLGLNTYVNNNADRFLARLHENGIEYIDIREYMNAADSFDMFYKTDHHWTVPAGKMAAEIIAEYLNLKMGYDIDLSLYSSDNFTYTEYKNAWLGEQGKKLGESYVGLDDYTLILPKYDTSFNCIYADNVISGTFREVLVDQSVYQPEKNEDVYEARSWHYSYMGHGGLSGSVVQNNYNPSGKKVLVLGDSYEQVTVPFLALGVSEVQTLVLRSYGDSLKQYIENQDIDIVIIAYAAFMIGAHDDETSANYPMFCFQ